MTFTGGGNVPPNYPTAAVMDPAFSCRFTSPPTQKPDVQLIFRKNPAAD